MEAGSEYDGAAHHRIYRSNNRIWTSGETLGILCDYLTESS
jgi:hypothetical protein